jgi:hypothetical protein
MFSQGPSMSLTFKGVYMNISQVQYMSYEDNDGVIVVQFIGQERRLFIKATNEEYNNLIAVICGE